MALDHAGALAFVVADYGAACAFFTESLAIRRTLGQVLPIAQSLLHLGGVVWRGLGDSVGGRRLVEESLGLAQAEGHSFLTAVAFHTCGDLALERGEEEDADALYRRAAALHQEGHRITTYPELLESFAALATVRQQAWRAVCLASAAQTHRAWLHIIEVPAVKAWRDHYRTPARQALSHEEEAAARAEGQAMTIEHAFMYALGMVRSSEAETQSFR